MKTEKNKMKFGKNADFDDSCTNGGGQSVFCHTAPVMATEKGNPEERIPEFPMVVCYFSSVIRTARKLSQSTSTFRRSPSTVPRRLRPMLSIS